MHISMSATVIWKHCRYYSRSYICNLFHFVLLASWLLLWSVFNMAGFSESVLHFETHSLSLCLPLSLLFFLLCPFFLSKCHSPPSRVEWSPFCCPSCAWSWSCTPAGAGVNVAASRSPRRAPVLRQLMKFTTSPQCWWGARPGRAWGTPGDRGQTPAVPSASGRHQFWMGTSRVWVDGNECSLKGKRLCYLN